MNDTFRNMNVKFLFRNLCYLLTRDLAADMTQPELRREILFQKILHLPMPMARDYPEEIEFLKQEGWAAFPYPQTGRLASVESGRDSGKGLPFVVHRGKRLYFPGSWSAQRAETAYRGYVESEGILGGGFRRKSPHQYQTEDCCVEEGDVVVDIGAAEGLFALDVVEKAKRMYLFECDPAWNDALAATFAPFASTVRIVNKRVGATDSRDGVRLDTFLKNETGERFFIKADIEGAEVAVVEASRKWLERESVRLCCCAYHRQDDAERLERLLNGIRYRTEFSDGYMLFSRDPVQKRPYFRRGVIRAWKASS